MGSVLGTDGSSQEKEKREGGGEAKGQPKANKNSEKELICKHTFQGEMRDDPIELEGRTLSRSGFLPVN